jgi:arginyl-tRNA synthetase
MDAWLRKQPLEQQLWHEMREWVLTAHAHTLKRLGLHIESHDCESESIEHAHRLVEIGLAKGLFEHDSSGAVIYKSGRPEYETMVLSTQGGVPTECLRLLAVYHEVIEALSPQELYFEMLGDEWRPAQTVIDDLLAILLRPDAATRYGWVYFGSVTLDGEKMGSSTGRVVWIDELLDTVSNSPGITAALDSAEGSVSRSEIVDIVVRSSFICAETTRPLAFSLEPLLEPNDQPPWTIATAWCRASRRSGSSHIDEDRTFLMQSQLFPRILRRSVEMRDPAPLAAYLHRLSRMVSDASGVGPAAQPVLAAVLRSLGFQISTSVGAREADADHLTHRRQVITSDLVGGHSA